MRVRAAFNWWRWVLACLFLTFAGPTPPAAQVEDAIGWVAEPVRSAPTRVAGRPPSVRAPVFSASLREAPHARDAARSPVVRRLYLWNCALLS